MTRDAAVDDSASSGSAGVVMGRVGLNTGAEADILDVFAGVDTGLATRRLGGVEERRDMSV